MACCLGIGAGIGFVMEASSSVVAWVAANLQAGGRKVLSGMGRLMREWRERRLTPRGFLPAECATLDCLKRTRDGAIDSGETAPSHLGSGDDLVVTERVKARSKLMRQIVIEQDPHGTRCMRCERANEMRC